VAYGLISPPIVAALAGLFVGCTPFKALFYGAGAPLSVLTEAMGTLSMAMIPCMLLLLGAASLFPVCWCGALTDL
jgi:predicted permease